MYFINSENHQLFSLQILPVPPLSINLFFILLLIRHMLDSLTVFSLLNLVFLYFHLFVSLSFILDNLFCFQFSNSLFNFLFSAINPIHWIYKFSYYTFLRNSIYLFILIFLVISIASCFSFSLRTIRLPR